MSVKVVHEMEAALREQAKSGTAMPTWQSLAYAEVLKRLLLDDEVLKALQEHSKMPEFTVEHREFYAGLCYRIRLELYGRGFSDKAARDTAKKWLFAPTSIRNTYAKRHKPQIENWLARIGANVRYEDMTRPEMLRAELDDLEPTHSFRGNVVRRKRRKSV